MTRIGGDAIDVERIQCVPDFVDLGAVQKEFHI
jgi:hypothetical protein